MADLDPNNIKEFADALGLTGKQAAAVGVAMEEVRKKALNLGDSSGRIRDLAVSFDATRQSILDTNAAAGTMFASLLRINSINADNPLNAFSNLAKVMFGSGDGANAYQAAITNLGGALDKILGTELSSVVKFFGGTLPTAFDTTTGTTRALTTDVIKLGSTFGLTFDQVARKTLDYQNAVIESNYYTFEGIDAVRTSAETLARYGVTVDETMKKITVSGTPLNLLKEGFLLASSTGLRSQAVFEMLGTASRKMGYSIEEANKPIVALENIARATGLPITDLTGKTFETAMQMSRLGLTVDGLSPVIRRFADTLGPAFKGLAIDEVNKLMGNLERQINTTNAAFIAMRGGLAGPGASAVGAQLAFEDAFKDPMEIMKSLATTLSGVTGGRIIKFEEARANPALENQFKIQRDLLAQITGNTDPQSQRTMLNVLDAIQTGRSLTSEQQSSLQDLLKDGQTKQDEMASINQQLIRMTVGLQTQTNVTLGNIFDRLAPAQVRGELTREAAGPVVRGAEAVLAQAQRLGAWAEEKVRDTVLKKLPEPGLQAGPGINVGPSQYSEQMLQGMSQARPRAGTAVPPAPTTEPGKMTQTNQPAGASTLQNVVITVQADANDTSQWLARQIKAVVDNTNAGGSRY